MAPMSYDPRTDRFKVPGLKVAPPAATLTITGTPPGGQVGAAYAWTPVISGGVAPYTLTGNGMPDGTSITGNGTNTPAVTGTPTTIQSLSGKTFTVTDSVGTTASISNRNFSILAAGTALVPNLFPNAQPNTSTGYSMSFPAGVAAGTKIIKISRRVVGSTLSLSPADGKITISDDGTNAYLVVGGTASSVGTPAYTITESLAGANNSPQSTVVNILVCAADNSATVSAAGYMNAADAGQVHNASQGAFGSRTRIKVRKRFKLGRTNYSKLRLGFSNFRIGSTTDQEEYSAATDFVIPSMYLEIPGAPTPVVQITMGGSTTITVPAGAALQFADEILPSAFGLTVFEDSTAVYARYYYDIGTGAAQCWGATAAAEQVLYYDPANEPGGANTVPADINGQGLFATMSGWQRLPAHTPVMLAGVPANTSIPSVFYLSDSIGDRLADSFGTGYQRRAATTAGVPCFSHTLGGRAAYMWTNNAAKSRAFLKFHNTLVDATGTNDISNGAVASVLRSQKDAIFVEARAAGFSKVIEATVIPRVSVGTTGNALTNYRCTDTAHQYPYFTGIAGGGGDGYEQGGRKDQFNTAIKSRALGGSGPDAVFDFASFAERAGDSSKYELRSFASTLTTAATVGATTLVMADAPTVGEVLVIELGVSNVDPPSPNNYGYPVLAVTGAGPYTVTVSQATSDADSGTGSNGQTVLAAHAIGAVVRATNSVDETHPTSVIHVAAGASLANVFLGTYPAYSFTNAEAAAYVGRMTSQPSDKRKQLFDTTVIGPLKTAGTFAKLDALWLTGAADAQAATLNLVGSSYTLTPTGTVVPTFSAGKGYVGNASSGYVSTGVAPTTGTTLHVQDSGHVGVCTLADTTVNSTIGAQNSRTSVNSKATTNSGGKVSQTTGGMGATAGTAANTFRHVVVNRTSSNAEDVTTNGAADGSATTASTSVASSLELFRYGGSAYADGTIFAAHVGSGLTSADKTALWNAIHGYAQGIGAAA